MHPRFVSTASPVLPMQDTIEAGCTGAAVEVDTNRMRALNDKAQRMFGVGKVVDERLTELERLLGFGETG